MISAECVFSLFLTFCYEIVCNDYIITPNGTIVNSTKRFYGKIFISYGDIFKRGNKICNIIKEYVI